jgi:DNA-binding NarL/FixJ family response regulator
MDIRMPRVDGIEATRQIVAGWPSPLDPADVTPSHPPDMDARPRIIILTTFDLDKYVYAALTAGASGFLLKDVTPEHLVAAIQLIRTGDALLTPSITRRLVERFASAPAARAPSALAASTTSSADRVAGRAGTAGCDVSALTPRELEVLGLIARGMSNTEIAASLVLSEATVKTHVARILTKLGLRDRVQAVVLAYESGLISPGT